VANLERAERYERAFLVLSAVMLVLFLGALGFSATRLGIHLPSRAGELDPTEVRSTPPFDEPGVRRLGPGEYEVVMIGQAWAYQPREIEVPAGSRVTFRATSLDVIHGLHIEGTRVNTFDRPGTHYMICHEYCGAGHHNMYGTLTVTEPGAAGRTPDAGDAGTAGAP